MNRAASSFRSAALFGLSRRLSLKSVKCRRCKNTAVCGACQQKTTIYCVLFAIEASAFQTKGIGCGKRESPLRCAASGIPICTKASASGGLPHTLLSWFKASPLRERRQEAEAVQFGGGIVQMWRFGDGFSCKGVDWAAFHTESGISVLCGSPYFARILLNTPGAASPLASPLSIAARRAVIFSSASSPM